jgi:hypothetical protein
MLTILGASLTSFLSGLWSKLLMVGGGIVAGLVAYAVVKQQGKNEAVADSLVEDKKNAEIHAGIEQSVVTASAADVDKRLQPFFRN